MSIWRAKEVAIDTERLVAALRRRLGCGPCVAVAQDGAVAVRCWDAPTGAPRTRVVFVLEDGPQPEAEEVVVVSRSERRVERRHGGEVTVVEGDGEVTLRTLGVVVPIDALYG